MSLAAHYCHFFDDDEFRETDRPGFRRRVITGEHLQLCFWRIKGGATGSFLHKHDDHESVATLISGRMLNRIGDEEFISEPGSVWRHPPGVVHSSE